MRVVSEVLALMNKVGPNGCWLWNGGLDKYGYGQLNWCGKIVRAHRLVYELVKGPIPPNHELHHKETCLKRCVNPDHNTPTLLKNHPDRLSTINRNKTHCPNGHEYNYFYRGHRYCLTCRKNRRKFGNPRGPATPVMQEQRA